MAGTQLTLPKIEKKMRTPIRTVLEPASPEGDETNGATFNLPHLPVMLKKKKAKESIREYIDKKRYLCLMEYNTSLRREEIDILVENVRKEEESLNRAEKQLKTEEETFEKRLQDSKHLCEEARKRAETAITLKMEKNKEQKRLKSHIDSIRSEISKYQDSLQELRGYEKFIQDVMAVDSEAFWDNPEGLMVNYDKLRDKNTRLLDIVIQEENAVEMVKDYTRWVRKTIDDAVHALEESQEDQTRKYKETQEKLNDLKQAQKILQGKLEDSRCKKFADADTELRSKIEAVYEACLMPNYAGLEPIELLVELEMQLGNLIEAADQQSKETFLQLLSTRIQQRREILRRSKLASRRPEEGCKRCQEKAKRTISTSAKKAR